MSTSVCIRRDDAGLWVEIDRCSGMCHLHNRREPILGGLPAPYSGRALALARRVQAATGVPGFLVLAALSSAYVADHADDRIAA